MIHAAHNSIAMSFAYGVRGREKSVSCQKTLAFQQTFPDGIERKAGSLICSDGTWTVYAVGNPDIQFTAIVHSP